jgi:DNA repair protein RAD5
MIKNHRSKASIAASLIEAKKRFCLSGTPIQNSADEMYSLFRFLRLPHMSDYKEFSNKIGSFLKKKKDDHRYRLGIGRLQTIVKSCLFRRTKLSKNKDGSSILTLPARHVEIVQCEFSKAERDFYEALQGHALDQFNRYLAKGTDFAFMFSQMPCVTCRLRRYRYEALSSYPGHDFASSPSILPPCEFNVCYFILS